MVERGQLQKSIIEISKRDYVAFDLKMILVNSKQIEKTKGEDKIRSNLSSGSTQPNETPFTCKYLLRLPHFSHKMGGVEGVDDGEARGGGPHFRSPFHRLLQTSLRSRRVQITTYATMEIRGGNVSSFIASFQEQGMAAARDA